MCGVMPTSCWLNFNLLGGALFVSAKQGLAVKLRRLPIPNKLIGLCSFCVPFFSGVFLLISTMTLVRSYELCSSINKSKTVFIGFFRVTMWFETLISIVTCIISCIVGFHLIREEMEFRRQRSGFMTELRSIQEAAEVPDELQPLSLLLRRLEHLSQRQGEFKFSAFKRHLRIQAIKEIVRRGGEYTKICEQSCSICTEQCTPRQPGFRIYLCMHAYHIDCVSRIGDMIGFCGVPGCFSWQRVIK